MKNGCSIGALGRDGGEESVENVHVQHCHFGEATSGPKIKTWPVFIH